MATISQLVDVEVDLHKGCGGTNENVLEFAASSEAGYDAFYFFLARGVAVTPKLFQRLLKMDTALLQKVLTALDAVQIATCLNTEIFGVSPLLHAAYHGLAEVVPLLLQYGGWNPEHKRCHLNAVQVARKYGHGQVADVIEAYLASPAKVLLDMGFADRTQNTTVLALAKRDLPKAIEILSALRT